MPSRRPHTWVDTVLDGPVATGLTGLLHALAVHADSDALGQKLLAHRPGIPDIYQGTELWRTTSSIRDNRRPVDFAARQDALDTFRAPEAPGGLGGVAAAPRASGHLPPGGYTALPADGERAEHAVAFGAARAGGRGQPMDGRIVRNRLGSTTPHRRHLADCLTDVDHRGTVAASTLFGAQRSWHC